MPKITAIIEKIPGFGEGNQVQLKTKSYAWKREIT